MFTKRLIATLLCVAVMALVSCAQPEPAPDPEPAPAAKPAEVAFTGPYFELTKDEITSQPDWTSQNVTFLGAKIGDKTKNVEKNFGKLDATEPLGNSDYYRSIYERSYAVYTHKMTGELQKIEVYAQYADKIKDAKLRRILTSSNDETMREVLGPEEGQDVNPDTTGIESIYDSKGLRVVKYELPNVKFKALLFSKLKK